MTKSPALISNLVRLCGTERSSLSRTIYRTFSYNSYTPTGPTDKGKTWERSARLVKNIDASNQYLEYIRAEHDPSTHIKTLEDELRGSIGQALGKQGEKVLRALRSMRDELEQYKELLDEYPMSSDIVTEKAKKYNFYRKQAKKARWELTVQRQAAGFIVNNHKFVSKHYAIGPPLPETEEEIEKFEDGDVKKESQVHSGQLDWWQRVGRWR